MKGKAAVITGSGSGIGQATAIALARRGVDLVVADIAEPGIAETVEHITAAGGRAIGLRCDVGVDHDLVHAHDACLDAFGRVDILMNNAGVLSAGLPEDIPVEEWSRVLDLNVTSIARGLTAFLPTFLAQGNGHIVNTGSTAGLYPHAFDRLPYATSKAAVLHLSANLALHLRPKGIGVSCLVPYGVPSGITTNMRWFGEHRQMAAAQLTPSTVEATGELVVDAIAHDRFLVLTAPEAGDQFRRYADDVDGFLRRPGL